VLERKSKQTNDPKLMLEDALQVEEEDEQVGKELHNMVHQGEQEEEVHQKEDLARLQEKMAYQEGRLRIMGMKTGALTRYA